MKKSALKALVEIGKDFIGRVFDVSVRALVRRSN